MSDLLLVYIGFSYLFMLGSAVADNFKAPWIGYFFGVIAAPVTFPFAIGFALTKGGKL